MKNNLLLSVFVFLLVGCAATVLSPQGKLVKYAKQDPADNCEELGQVDAVGMKLGGVDSEEQINRLKERTAAKGGNYFRLDSINRHGFKEGTAFKCP